MSEQTQIPLEKTRTVKGGEQLPVEEKLPANLPVETDTAALAPSVNLGSIYTNPAAFEHCKRVATVFSHSQLVPEHYRGKLADCIIAVELANRLDVHPMMVMQNTHVVHGKPGLDGKFVIALMNTRGRFDEPLTVDEGVERGKDTYGSRWRTKLKGKTVEYTITVADAKNWGWYQKNGSAWQKDPKLMATYRSAKFLANTYCPEVLMGLSTSDEIADIVEVGPVGAAALKMKLQEA